MSWECVNWANRQRTRSPSEQLVLLLLANWATPEGIVRDVDVEKLAPCSRQSRASVFRRLKDLEEIGLLTRQRPDKRPDNNARVSGFLHLDMLFQGESDESQIETDPPESQIETDVSRTGETDVSLTGETPIKDSTQKKNSNPSLSLAADVSTHARERDDQTGFDEDFSELVAAYPCRQWMSLTEAKLEYRRLTADERSQARRWAAPYASAIAEGKRRSIKSLADWLRDKDFEGLRLMASARPAAPAAVGASSAAPKPAGTHAAAGPPTVFVKVGTPAWDAWVRAGHRPGLRTNKRGPEGGDGWYFPTLYPLTKEA